MPREQIWKKIDTSFIVHFWLGNNFVINTFWTHLYEKKFNYVDVDVYISVTNLQTHATIHIDTYINTYIHVSINIDTHVYTYMHIHTYIHLSMHLDTRMHIYIHVSIHIHTHTLIYIYIYIYIYTHRFTHIYIYNNVIKLCWWSCQRWKKNRY